MVISISLTEKAIYQPSKRSFNENKSQFNSIRLTIRYHKLKASFEDGRTQKHIQPILCLFVYLFHSLGVVTISLARAIYSALS